MASQKRTDGPTSRTPDTFITKGPRRVTSRAIAKFRFKSTKHNSTFLCKLDDKRRKRCSSPKRYRVSKGRHRLKVRAVDRHGQKDPIPAVHRWKRR